MPTPPIDRSAERSPTIFVTHGAIDMKKTGIFLAPFFLLAAAALYFFARAEPEPDRADRMQTRAVTTGPVLSERIDRRARFSGVIQAADRASISFTLGGRVVARHVEIGQRVEQGALIAVLDQQPFRLARDEARGGLAELEARRAQNLRDVARIEGLVAEKAAPREELEKTRAQTDTLAAAIETARAVLAEAERRLDESELRAPFDGTVTHIHTRVGEIVAGQPVVTLSGTGLLELEVEVPEPVALGLTAGAEATVVLPLSGKRQVSGRIAHLGRATGPGKLFPVLIHLEDGHLIPGQTAELILDLAGEPQLTVPIDAVLNPGGQQPRVYRVRDSEVFRIPVEIGRIAGTRVGVSGDLREGDSVVTGGFFGLADGEPVEVIQ